MGWERRKYIIHRIIIIVPREAMQTQILLFAQARKVDLHK